MWHKDLIANKKMYSNNSSYRSVLHQTLTLRVFRFDNFHAELVLGFQFERNQISRICINFIKQRIQLRLNDIHRLGSTIIDDFYEGGAASSAVAQSPVFGTQFNVKMGISRNTFPTI